ncbi:hypothetical protein H7S74_16925 [Priestia aryabhattai]|uniref:hypothetical protein n=1 Tax=Priestia TaxID=2800373 RepID=UPI001ECA95A6|nr:MULTISPECIES: hypothetical protein [Priestia]MBY0092605.1 hypothetical protein [Priestia aryabhattai]MBY0103048.1 hypothetical protein [Priestia aryabhattai]MCY9023607.1 hypothetical protein [Priestia megaterium]
MTTFKAQKSAIKAAVLITELNRVVEGSTVSPCLNAWISPTTNFLHAKLVLHAFKSIRRYLHLNAPSYQTEPFMGVLP